MGGLILKSGTLAFTNGYSLDVGYDQPRSDIDDASLIIENGAVLNWLVPGGSLYAGKQGTIWAKAGATINSTGQIVVGSLDDNEAKVDAGGEGAIFRIDGTLNAGNMVRLGHYGLYRKGVLMVSGQVNLTGDATFLGSYEPTITGGQLQLGNGGIIHLKGGIISAVEHQAIGLSWATPSGLIRGNGTFQNIDIRLGGGPDSIYTGNKYGVLSPGDADEPTGTITIENGFLTAAASTSVLLDLASTGAHDRIQLTTGGQTATIAEPIVFNALDNLAGAHGVYDFVIASTIVYNGVTLSAGDDIADIDNLDDLLDAAGLMRVTGAAPSSAGEYRYYVADVDGGLTALRLEVVPIPEPASLSLLALGGLLAMRRRRK